MHQKVQMRNKSRGCCSRCILGTLLYILIVLCLVFVVVFVIVPIVFKYSVGIQRNIIFPSWVIQPKNYSNIDSFGIKGVKNFYLKVNQQENVTLGLWQILPSEMLSDAIENHEYNFDGALTNGNYNVLLYMHGNGADRAGSQELYDILRKYFHIFAVDYRGYADSSPAEMTETKIVNDMMYVYKWLKNHSNSDLFVWGHSLGTGVGTHLVANLKGNNISAKGLVLETPFTSVTDVMMTNPIIQVYSYLPWFRTTIIDPIIDNDFDFNSKKHILDDDCPIMILHAKDDTIIPYKIGLELYSIAINNRETDQGNITLHLFDALGYDHMYIYNAPELPQYVSEFVDDCQRFEQKKKKL